MASLVFQLKTRKAEYLCAWQFGCLETEFTVWTCKGVDLSKADESC
jgi:hypothetical protein